jgi:hypothetical protein
MRTKTRQWRAMVIIPASLCLASAILLREAPGQITQPPSDEGEGILRQAPIDIDEKFIKQLGRAERGTKIPLSLFDDVSFVAVTTSLRETDWGFDWFGKIPAQDVGDVILSVAGGSLVGAVWIDSDVYSIHEDGQGGYRVDQTDPSVFEPTHLDEVEVSFRDRTIPFRALENGRVIRAIIERQANYNEFHRQLVGLVTAGLLRPDRVLPVIPEPGSRVDILLATTARADEWLTSNSYPRTATMQNLIIKANTALAESGIATQLNFLGVASVHYTETDDPRLVDDLTNLRGRPNEDPAQPPHPDLQELHALRDKLRADIVSLLVYPEDPDGRGQSIRLPGPAGSDPTPNDGKGPFESVGFNVVRIDAAVKGHTLTHEVAHNFGAAHDNYQFAKDEAAGLVTTAPSRGGHGFIVLPQDVRTIMAYRTFCVEVLGQPDTDDTCPIIPRFSNSLQTYNGSPLGIAVGVFFGAADNAAVMNMTAQTVANFRHAYVAP